VNATKKKSGSEHDGKLTRLDLEDLIKEKVKVFSAFTSFMQ